MTPIDRPRRVPARFPLLFAALVAAQAAHSLEACAGRLWESFPPARFVAGLVSPDPELGFLAVNVALLLFGVVCVAAAARRADRWAVPLAWAWVGIETLAGLGHPLWSLSTGGYTPGVVTAPLQLALAVALARGLYGASGPVYGPARRGVVRRGLPGFTRATTGLGESDVDPSATVTLDAPATVTAEASAPVTANASATVMADPSATLTAEASAPVTAVRSIADPPATLTADP